MKDETKELLTLAAKAIGLKIEDWTEAGNPLVRKPGIGCWAWNPIYSADDLVEMECQMSLETIWAEDRCIVTAWFSERSFGAHELYSKHPSRRAAKAMASLRVVAEIGRRMEEGAGK